MRRLVEDAMKAGYLLATEGCLLSADAALCAAPRV